LVTLMRAYPHSWAECVRVRRGYTGARVQAYETQPQHAGTFARDPHLGRWRRRRRWCWRGESLLALEVQPVKLGANTNFFSAVGHKRQKLAGA